MTTHGTIGAYTNHKCRCDECRAVWSRYSSKRRQQRMNGDRAKRGAAAPEKHNANTYLNWGCRCEVCQKAFQDRSRVYSQKYDAAVRELIGRHRDEFDALRNPA